MVLVYRLIMSKRKKFEHNHTWPPMTVLPLQCRGLICNFLDATSSQQRDPLSFQKDEEETGIIRWHCRSKDVGH